ncbi:MAG: hypothetical protein AABY10_06125 [Nanoarchaeota archaeon]
MEKIGIKISTALVFLVLAISLSSAVTLNSVDVDPMSPGKEGSIRMEIENILNEDVEDVSVSLKFINTPFIPIGSSDDSVDEINEDDEESFVFRIKASNNILPGDYEIPYTITYRLKNSDNQLTKSGSIGIKVISNPELSFTINVENPVENQKGKISIKIVNKGFYEARFVSIKVLPTSFTLLSDPEIYIGSVDSDDFETANFDVIFKKSGNSNVEATVDYIDFENKKQTKSLDLPISVYSQEKALELGIIQANRVPLYLGLLVGLIVLIFVIRYIRRRMRLRKSMQARNTNGGK